MMEYAVAQLIKALRCKPEGCGFDSGLDYWDFSLTFNPCGCRPAVDSATNTYEYVGYILGSKGGRCLGLQTFRLQVPTAKKYWEPQTLRALRACLGLYRGCSTFALNGASFFWRYSPQWALASSFTRFLDHIRHTTVGRTPLDE
jgi:hypothetical protein